VSRFLVPTSRRFAFCSCCCNDLERRKTCRYSHGFLAIYSTWVSCPLGITGTIAHNHQDASLGLGEVVQSDVCIIGGGSSGTYSAIRLKEMGKTVTLIERQSRLGGHVNTYVDPASGASFDYGVISFDNSSIVRNYFAHFDIPLGSAYTFSKTTSEFANFKTGEYSSNFSLPSPEALATTLLGYQVNVSTLSGPKIINASKLLIAIDPKLENLSFLDLVAEEKDLFGQFNDSYYWDAIVKNTAIPNDVIITNIDLDAPYDIPSTPGVYRIVPSTIAGLFTLYYTSPSLMTNEEVQADILATIARLEAPTELHSLSAADVGTGTPEFVEFHNHSPFELTVSTEAIKGGFYGQLNTLQGERSTWWTGATWRAQDSSQIWNWTEINILPKLAA
jgi:hypothetical protein